MICNISPGYQSLLLRPISRSSNIVCFFRYFGLYKLKIRKPALFSKYIIIQSALSDNIFFIHIFFTGSSRGQTPFTLSSQGQTPSLHSKTSRYQNTEMLSCKNYSLFTFYYIRIYGILPVHPMLFRIADIYPSFLQPRTPLMHN